MKHTPFLLFILSFVFLAGCRQDALINDVQVIKPTVKITVRSDIKGLIRDENGTPIAQALVRIGKNVQYTGLDGTFVFNNITVPKDQCLVQVEKKGYFKNSYLFASSAGGVNLALLHLKKKDDPKLINAATGGKISYPDGSAIEIPANALLNSNGTPYTGTAELHAHWLDPTAPDLVDRMPGALQATDASGTEGVLLTFGMMVFELNSALGEPLNLVKGRPATLTLPIPSSSQSNTPGTIPVWFLNPATGQWAPRGNSTSNIGNSFNINADSTGFWNLDKFGEGLWLNGTFLNGKDSSETQWQKIVVEDGSGRFKLRHFTSQAGTFRMRVLKNAPMTLKLYDQCNELVYEKQIEPLSKDHDAGVLYTQQPLSEVKMTINLSSKECGPAPVVKGLCLIEFGQNLEPFFYAADGTLNDQYKMTCHAIPELRVTNYDLTHFKKGGSLKHSADKPLQYADLLLCDPVQDSMTLLINGSREAFLGCRYRVYQHVAQNWLEIQAFNDSGKIKIKAAPYKGPGVYNITVEAGLTPWRGNKYPLMKGNGPDITLRITSDSNDQVTGVLEGLLYPTSGPATYVTIPFTALKSF